MTTKVNQEFKTVTYKNIHVKYLSYLHGGGMGFGQQFLQVVKERFGHVDHVFEYCAGPGFIGFSLLANKLCDRLTLADINPDAIVSVQETIRANKLEGRVKVYQSDCLDSIPAQEKWDLIVSNPPHWPATEKEYKENIRNFDPHLIVHKKFYQDIRKFLKPKGTILFQELEAATSVEDFRQMIEENGLEIKDVFKIKPLSVLECVMRFKNIRKNTKPAAFYFIQSQIKT